MRLKLLALMRRHCNDRITAFELISRHSLELVWKHVPGTRDPLAQPHPWYVLTELEIEPDAAALGATHLFGRKLAIEYAAGDKAGAGAGVEEMGPQR